MSIDVHGVVHFSCSAVDIATSTFTCGPSHPYLKQSLDMEHLPPHHPVSTFAGTVTSIPGCMLCIRPTEPIIFIFYDYDYDYDCCCYCLLTRLCIYLSIYFLRTYLHYMRYGDKHFEVYAVHSNPPGFEHFMMVDEILKLQVLPSIQHPNRHQI